MTSFTDIPELTTIVLMDSTFKSVFDVTAENNVYKTFILFDNMSKSCMRSIISAFSSNILLEFKRNSLHCANFNSNGKLTIIYSLASLLNPYHFIINCRCLKS